MVRKYQYSVDTDEKDIKVSKEKAWLITFNDLMTLLVVFFVFLYSMSSIDCQRIQKFQHSLQKALDSQRGGNKKDVDIKDSKIFSQMLRDQDELMEVHRDEIGESIKAIQLEPGIMINHTKEGLVLTLKDNIFFKSGMVDIQTDSLSALDKVISIIKGKQFPVRIEGHTDDVPIHTEKFPSNWELSIARAITVLEYFIKTGHISPERLSVAGYGDLKPLFPNDSAMNRSQNRRVQVVLVMEEEKRNEKIN